jgi:hypothetical protein
MKTLLTATEIGMLAYWAFATVVALGWFMVPPEVMYPDHSNPLIVIWNWSFLPIDVLFATLGLVARFGRVSEPKAQILQTISLALMFCAGTMAISFWALQCWFDFAWWGMNVWLIVLAAFGCIKQMENVSGKVA